MSDRTSLLQSQHELKFSGEQGFFDKSKIIRFLIILLFATTIFGFLHFREVNVESLELNHIAPNYVISQIDFTYPDEETTLLLRQNSVREIGKIYLLSPREIRKRNALFHEYLGTHPDLKKEYDDSLGAQSSSSELFLNKWLSRLRFSDSETFKKIKDMNLLPGNLIMFQPDSSLTLSQLPASVWTLLDQQNAEGSKSEEILKNYYQGVEWKYEEDLATEKNLKKQIEQSIPEKIGHVFAGDRLLDQGEKVTARHLAMLQSMKQTLGENRNLSHPATLLGTLILTLLFLGIFFTYLKTNQTFLLASNRKLFLLVTILVLTLFLSKLIEFLLINSRLTLMEVFRYPLFVPLAAILTCSLINPSVATFTCGFLSIISAVALAFEWEGLLILNITASLVAILNTYTLRKRKEIFVVCGKAWLAASAAILALHLYQNTYVNFGFLTDILSAGIFMLITAILVVGLLPLLEAGFGVMTDVTLMEYMDPNHDLLRRLTIEAPGTYQHSVIVGNLAEAAALSIGANGLFCRVATLYHDVGKVMTPQYFTENQSDDVNIHQLLTPQESAQVIMAHVAEGVVLGREAGLPEPIIDIVKEHHGTTLVYYFYRKELDRMGGDKRKVDERDFRYPGPKPRSKEAGIIMITDSFEAASRSLDVINEPALTDLAKRIVQSKFCDGQLDDCLLTTEELAIVSHTLVKTLLASGHSRVKYPAEEIASSKLEESST